MPIQHFLVVLLIALAVPLQASHAACQCFKERPASPTSGYLDLEPTACNTTPSGFGWLKVAPDTGTGEPNPPMYVALRSSRTFSGCSFINYNSAWPNGPSKVLLDYCFGCGTCNNPPSLVLDFRPPDSERPSTCSTTARTTDAYGYGFSCSAAYADAKNEGETTASVVCTAGACPGSFHAAYCKPTDRSRTYFSTYGTYTYYCYNTTNLCR